MHEKKNYNHKSNAKVHKTEEIYKNIVKKLQEIIDKGDYEKFLKFQRNFRNYSFNNVILIFSQYQDATKVAR